MCCCYCCDDAAAVAAVDDDDDIGAVDGVDDERANDNKSPQYLCYITITHNANHQSIDHTQAPLQNILCFSTYLGLLCFFSAAYTTNQ
jgi:hypothetical protein